MRHTFSILALALAAAACGGGGAALGPTDPGTPPEPAFAALSITPSAASLAAGSQLPLSATPLDGSGAAMTGLPAPQWRSSNPAVATVGAEGTVAGVSPGVATITASLSAGGVSREASAEVTVTAGPAGPPSSATVTGVHDGFTPQTVTIGVGGTVTWVMTEDEEHDITWDGPAPPGGDIARLDEDERASRTFPAAGTYTYHCDHHDSRVEAGTVVVTPGGGDGSPPVFTAVTVAPSPAGVAVGASLQLTATPRDQFGNPMAGVAAATWQSSNPALATVSSSGAVTGVAAGSVTITATMTHAGTTRSGAATVSVGTTTNPGTATVRTVDRSFSPRAVTIATGGTVTWEFTDTHNVTFRGSAPTGGSIGNTSSGSVSRQFGTAGTYNYDCSLHSGMSGTVTVQ